MVVVIAAAAAVVVAVVPLAQEYRRSSFCFRARSFDTCIVVLLLLMLLPVGTLASTTAAAAAAVTAALVCLSGIPCVESFFFPSTGEAPMASPLLLLLTPCFSSREARPSLVCSNRGHGPTPGDLSFQSSSALPPPLPPRTLPRALPLPFLPKLERTEATPPWGQANKPLDLEKSSPVVLLPLPLPPPPPR